MLQFPQYFSEAEVRAASEGMLPDARYEANAQSTLDWLEAAREYVGLPFLLTSFGRSAEHNAALPGAAADSQHLQWLAADFDVQGMTNSDAAVAIIQGQEAGAIPAYHQLITYETDGHLHVGVAGGHWLADLQNLIKTTAGKYVELTTERLAQLAQAAQDNPTGTAVIAAVVAVAFFFPAIASARRA